jgi:hypothetical protein
VRDYYSLGESLGTAFSIGKTMDKKVL